jgi:hypothetical protein
MSVKNSTPPTSSCLYVVKDIIYDVILISSPGSKYVVFFVDIISGVEWNYMFLFLPVLSSHFLLFLKLVLLFCTSLDAIRVIAFYQVLRVINTFSSFLPTI